MGRLTYIEGVMGAGKTHRLLTMADEIEAAGQGLILVKHSNDSERKGDKIRSRHKGQPERTADISIDDLTELYDHALDVRAKKIGSRTISCTAWNVLCDEGQFYEEQHAIDLKRLATEQDMDVRVVGLGTDAFGKVFPGRSHFDNRADVIETIEMLCGCERQLATKNCRFSYGNIVLEGEQNAVDGVDGTTYEAMCQTCYDDRVEEACRQAVNNIYTEHDPALKLARSLT